MSVTVFRDRVAAVVTHRTRMFPPHILKGLMQTNVTAALGTLQIMVGLFNIGLGPGRIKTNPEDLTSLGAAYWLGAVFIIAGVMSILAGRFPSLCLVGFAVFVNIVGSVFAIVGVVLYARDVADAPDDEMCDWTRLMRPYEIFILSKAGNCKYVAFFVQRLLRAMDITMIVLAVLQLCVCISFAVLGIKAVVDRKKLEVLQPQLKEALLTSPDA